MSFFSRRLNKAPIDTADVARHHVGQTLHGRPHMNLACCSLVVVSTLSTSLPEGWAKLLALIQNDAKPTVVRTTALAAACQVADADGGAGLTTLAAAWIAAVDQNGPPNPLAAKRALVETLVRRGAPRLNVVVSDQEGLLSLWTTAATRSWLDDQTKLAALHAITTSPAPLSERRAAALAVLEEPVLRRAPVAASELIPLFDAPSLPALRDLVSQAADPVSFNYVAASSLAYMGDQQIVEQLEAFKVAWGDAYPEFAKAATWYLWQIEQQQPATKLLQVLAASETYTARSRAWALSRAIELGLPTQDIRESLLTYAASLPAEAVAEAGSGLAVLKKLGIGGGVLTTSDIPDVALVDQGASTAVPDNASPLSAVIQVGWRPSYESRPAFLEWCTTRPWQGLVKSEVVALLKQKLCEFSLLQPSKCASE